MAGRQISADVGIPADLKEIVNPADLDFLSESAYACRPGNPRETSIEEIKELCRRLLQLNLTKCAMMDGGEAAVENCIPE